VCVCGGCVGGRLQVKTPMSLARTILQRREDFRTRGDWEDEKPGKKMMFTKGKRDRV
jgi:hypothetical protein